MKPFFILPIVFFSIVYAQSQQPFILSLEQPELDYISDVMEISDQFYFIQNRIIPIESESPFDNDSYCDIIITSLNGSVIDIINLNGFRTKYLRILKVIGNEIFLVGTLKSDSCKSQMVISKFNMDTHDLEHISSFDFCENIMLNIKIVKGLHDQTFIEEYHTETLFGFGIEKSIFSIDSLYTITPVFDDLSYIETLSIDFARTGYVIASIGLYNFYDTQFSFRKQIYSGEDILEEQETHKPFGHHLILEQTIQDRFSLPNAGVQIRLVDSSLHVKKKAVIFPMHSFHSAMNLPFFGGIEIKNENEIWASAMFGFGPILDSCFYSLTKLDSNLNIICQHFIGYDTWYRIFGIRALASGGAIVFGNRVREGFAQNVGEDIYAIRVGDNCELPTTAIEGEQNPIISISAYPNPGINELTFSVHGFDPATLHMELINELGQILYTGNDLSQRIQLPDLPAGQYFYRILQKEKVLGAGSWVKQ